MGTIITAICKAECGFKQENIYYGAGRATFKTECNVPAFNKKTGEFLEENYFDKGNLPEHIVFYNSPEMFEGEIEKYRWLEWGDVYLKPDKNLCPNCRNFSMMFWMTGCFD
jgi:hypothetical protein